MPSSYSRPLFYSLEQNEREKAVNKTIELLEKAINMLEENTKRLAYLQDWTKRND